MFALWRGSAGEERGCYRIAAATADQGQEAGRSLLEPEVRLQKKAGALPPLGAVRQFTPEVF
jgi:hypothetical protein